MSDEKESARAELLRRVEEVAKGPVSLEALYELEPAFVYADFWHVAREQLRNEIRILGQEALWTSELRRPPLDLKLWVPFIYRRETTDASIQQATKQWDAAGSEKFFRSHQSLAGISEGVAALHVGLLSDLDPVAAIEYVAALPDEHFIWSAARRMQLKERPELIDRVLMETLSTNAVLLSLACELDALHSVILNLRNVVQWPHGELEARQATIALEAAWAETIPSRFKAIANILVQRQDVTFVLGPLMRHLVRSTVPRATQDSADRIRIFRLGIDAILAALTGTEFEVARAEKPDAACVISRILVANVRGQVSSLWDEWIALILMEDDSLDKDNVLYWSVAGQALYEAGHPLELWNNSLRQIEPLLRARARRMSRGVDPTVHLIMPAVHAAAAMSANGKELWCSLYKRARRHFFVDSPSENEFGYRLCAYVFSAFPRVFGDDPENLERALLMLPTPEHVEWARAQLPANEPDPPG